MCRVEPVLAEGAAPLTALAEVLLSLATAFQPDRQAHDLAYEPHDLFWDKECAVRPNGLGCRLFED